ncbi:hypothetical protein ACTFIZ_011886 [Dictyostelium cf. discoideum]
MIKRILSLKLSKKNKKDEIIDNTDFQLKYKLVEYNSIIKRDISSNSISFKVCEVDQNPWDSDNKFILDNFIKSEIEITKNNYCKENINENSKIIKKDILENFKVLQTSLTQDLVVVGAVRGGSNSFVYSAWESYNNHHHLVLRPDNIWMAILTQFSFYINKNSEELRDKFVDFNNKKTLVVTTGYPILEAPFDELTIEMSNQIQSNIKDPSIKDLIIPNFTTTTESDKVVFSIALMSTMKNYFNFEMRTLCGLSEVTLLGEINDWINLKERVEKLIQFDNKKGEIKKWLHQYLLEVIDKFIESANGNPDTTWWNQIVNYKQQSGGSVLTGWLATFCVFDNDGNFNDDKEIYDDFIIKEKQKKKFKWPRVNADSIPNGFVSCPIKLKDIEQEYNSTIYSGHFGSKLLDNNLKLIPSLDCYTEAIIASNGGFTNAFTISILPTLHHGNYQTRVDMYFGGENQFSGDKLSALKNIKNNKRCNTNNGSSGHQ